MRSHFSLDIEYDILYRQVRCRLPSRRELEPQLIPVEPEGEPSLIAWVLQECLPGLAHVAASQLKMKKSRYQRPVDQLGVRETESEPEVVWLSRLTIGS